MMPGLGLGLALARRKKAGTDWTPKALAGLLLWLDAGKIAGLADGAALAIWEDQSGNNNHCTQATEVNKPVYSTGIGGRPEVAFSYNSLSITPRRWMTIPAGVSIDLANSTVIFVGRPVSRALQAGYVVPIVIGTHKVGYSPTSTALYSQLNYDGAVLVGHEPGMVAVQSGAGGIKVWYDDTSEAHPAFTAGVMTGGCLGADSGGLTYHLYGTLSEVLVYNRALSDAEMLAVRNYLRTRYYGTPAKQVIFDGDSLTTGYDCGNHANLPGQAWGLLGRDWRVYSVAVAGQTLQQMQSDAATEVDPLYSAGLAKNVLVCWEGMLDVYYAATVATALARMETYCAARRAAGWKVIVVTCTPSNYISEANRTELNAGIRANWATWADGLADVAADARIGAAGANDNPVYYNNADGNKTHMTRAGFAVVAGIVKAAIDGLA